MNNGISTKVEIPKSNNNTAGPEIKKKRKERYIQTNHEGTSTKTHGILL